MKTITETIYLHAVVRETDSEICYVVSDSSMSYTPEYTVCAEQEITFELPDPKTITPLMVSTLQTKKKAMQAASSAAIQEVENQISSLLALPNHQEVS